MPAGLFGRVSPSSSNSNASAQNGGTGRNGNSSGGAPNGAVRLRGEVGKYNGANTVEYDTGDFSSSYYSTHRVDENYGTPTFVNYTQHPTHTFTVNSGIGSTFTTTSAHTGQSNSGSISSTDKNRSNVKMSDFYTGGSRVPDTIGNYSTIPSSGEIRMSAFRDQAQLPTKAEMRTAYLQLGGPAGQGTNYRYSGTQGANEIGNTLFTVNINATDNPVSNFGYSGVNENQTMVYSYYGSTAYENTQGGVINSVGLGKHPGPTRFVANHKGLDDSTIANYHTSGSRYNTSIPLDLWLGPKHGWATQMSVPYAGSTHTGMPPQTYSFGGHSNTNSLLRDNSLWKAFLQSEWTTIYIQHTALGGFPSTHISDFTVYAYDPYKNFGSIYGSQTWAYAAGNSIGSKTFTPVAVTNHDSRFRSYYIQVPTNIANIHRIMGTFYKNSSNIISLRTLSFLPGKFTFSSNSTQTSGGTAIGSYYSSSNDNGYGFVLCGMGASRSPDSSMYNQAAISDYDSNNSVRSLQVNADYWYDGAFHEVAVMDTSSGSRRAGAYVNPTGRMVSARGPYLDIGVADLYQD
tara:strand:- start:758 stop:2473 length:1716 start_codon:yes stop_codon:yes gene_type:complete